MLLVSLVPRLYLFATRSFKQRIKIDVTTRGSQLVIRLSQRPLAGLYCLIKTIPTIFRLDQQIWPPECSTPMKRLETREVLSLARQKRRGSRFTRLFLVCPQLFEWLLEDNRKHSVTICTQIFNLTHPSPLRLFSFYPLIVFAFIPRALDDDQICDHLWTD